MQLWLNVIKYFDFIKKHNYIKKTQYCKLDYWQKPRTNLHTKLTSKIRTFATLSKQRPILTIYESI